MAQDKTQARPQVVHGRLALIAGESKMRVLFWLIVVLAAGGADMVTFYQVLVLVLNVPDTMVWIAVGGFTVVALTLAHYAGFQARQTRNPRDLAASPMLAWGFAIAWFLLGLVAFVVRYVVAQTGDASSGMFVVDGGAQSTPTDNAEVTSQHLAALLFLVLYVATGAVSGLAGYFRHEPSALEYGRAVKRRTKLNDRYAVVKAKHAQVEQTLQSIARVRERREQAWERAQAQCTSAAERLKQEARLLLAARTTSQLPTEEETS